MQFCDPLNSLYVFEGEDNGGLLARFFCGIYGLFMKFLWRYYGDNIEIL